MVWPQVTALRSAVRRSIEITNSTTFMQRVALILRNPVNRRALSMLCLPDMSPRDTNNVPKLSVVDFKHTNSFQASILSCMSRFSHSTDASLYMACIVRYYSATLFKEIGFNQPTAVGLIVSGTNFLFTLFALKYIDIIGRRKIMIFSAQGMVVGLVLASISFFCECYAA